MTRPEEVWAGIRAICNKLPEAEESTMVHHECFRVAGKAFVILGDHTDLNIAVKTGKEMQGVFLEDPRFFKTPYIGQHGWVSLRAGSGKLNWKEIEGLIEQSYRLTAPKRLIKALSAAR